MCQANRACTLQYYLNRMLSDKFQYHKEYNLTVPSRSETCLVDKESSWTD